MFNEMNHEEYRLHKIATSSIFRDSDLLTVQGNFPCVGVGPGVLICPADIDEPQSHPLVLFWVMAICAHLFPMNEQE